MTGMTPSPQQTSTPMGTTRQLSVFQQISLDGYFTDARGDMSWAKRDNDEEFNAFTSANAQRGGMLIFGRVTYQMMAGFWSSPAAKQMMPAVAERMNALPKVVFSRTLADAPWQNTQLAKGDLLAEIRALKRQPGPALTILGSGTIVAQLASAGLIDEYQLVVIPVVLGSGRTLFDGVKGELPLRLTQSRTFRNGKVYLCYQPDRGA